MAEIGRPDPTLKRLLRARRAIELMVQLCAQRALRLARPPGRSSCNNNPHRGVRNRSVDPPAGRPQCARWPFRNSGRLQRRFPGRPNNPGIGEGPWLQLAPLEGSCPNNPHRGARNWSWPSDPRATLVRPQVPAGLRSDSRATPRQVLRATSRSRTLGEGSSEVLTSNRSPVRWPKLVGRCHLPSAVCPPSEISGLPWPKALAESQTCPRWPCWAGGWDKSRASTGLQIGQPMGAKSCTHNKSPMRCPKSFGDFHLPTVAVPPSDRRRPPSRPFRSRYSCRR